MGLTQALRKAAFARPAAFVVIAPGGARHWHALLDRGLCTPAGAPHDADLLVVAGDVPVTWDLSLAQLFETLALPRAAVWVGPPDGRRPAGLPFVAADAGPIAAAMADDGAPGNLPFLADRPPAPWRGRGPYGQGGEGMMGGVPYGRPMAMTGPDPDGLALADTPVALGPFFPGLPSGLRLRLRKQGERIRAVETVENLVPARAARGQGGRAAPVAAVEAERIERHMLCCSVQLRLLGLDSLAERFRRARAERDPGRLETLFKWVERTGIANGLRGIGTITRAEAEERGLCGPAARATGLAVDPRRDDPAYRPLRFRVATATGGDAWARWQVRREEIFFSLRPIVRSAGARAEFPGSGDDSRALMRLLPGLLAGKLWSEAVLAVASLDLDMTRAALP